MFLSVIVAASCQYPQQRAPPPRYRPAPEEYDEEYAPPPRQAPPPQPIMRPDPRPNIVHKPASVHYVNIGLELAGDYKFGYDTGKGDDQSFREETRLPDGSVTGAYGYIDETGKQRIVKYTAGKDGFKVQSDTGVDDAPKPASRPAPASAPPRPAPVPQQAYRPPPQPAYSPQPAPRPQPQPSPYRAAPPAEPAYRPPPQPQPRPAYRAPPPPQPRPAYRAPPPQPAYAPEPEYRPQPRPQSRPHVSRPKPAPRPVDAYEEPDYDYPNNEISERRLVPVDTSLFNYNIGTSHK